MSVTLLEKKSTIVEAESKIYLRCISQKNLICEKRNLHDGDMRQNVPEVHELKKPHLREEKFVIVKAQNKMCLKHVS